MRYYRETAAAIMMFRVIGTISLIAFFASAALAIVGWKSIGLSTLFFSSITITAICGLCSRHLSKYTDKMDRK